MVFNNRMTVKGIIRGYEAQVFIDCGSCISIIGGKMFKKIKRFVEVEAAEFDKIVAVNTTETAVAGLIRARIKIGKFSGVANLNVLPEANHEILLGRDFLWENGIDILFSSGKLILGNIRKTQPNINASSDHGGKEALAKAAEKTTISPGKEQHIKIYPSNDILALKLLFTSNQKSTQLGIAARNQCVSGIENTMTIKVKNIINKKIIIPTTKL